MDKPRYEVRDDATGRNDSAPMPETLSGYDTPAWRLPPDRTLADDVSQETVFKICRTLGQFTPGASYEIMTARGEIGGRANRWFSRSVWR